MRVAGKFVVEFARGVVDASCAPRLKKALSVAALVRYSHDLRHDCIEACKHIGVWCAGTWCDGLVRSKLPRVPATLRAMDRRMVRGLVFPSLMLKTPFAEVGIIANKMLGARDFPSHNLGYDPAKPFQH